MSDLTTKLRLLIPRLASDADGEVLATVAAIRRVLAAEGLDLHDLAAALTADHEPTPAELAQACMASRTAWREHEIDFLKNARASARAGRRSASVRPNGFATCISAPFARRRRHDVRRVAERLEPATVRTGRARYVPVDGS